MFFSSIIELYNKAMEQIYPAAQNRLRERVRGEFFDSVHKGEIELVTAGSKNPKLSQLAKDFEDMLQHPLCRRFLKNSPKLYFTHASIDGQDFMPVATTVAQDIILVN